MLNYSLEFINRQAQLVAIVERAIKAGAVALDIETVNWWDRQAERVALVQLSFREATEPHVAVIDALAGLDLEPLRRPLELSLAMKAIHNASYDAARLQRHYRISTSPIHDTMLAARRSGEKKYSLQAQVALHLGLQLDKREQRGDWSRRPLSLEQLQYAALDAACTLLLYEQQVARGLRGDYELRERLEKRQAQLPLSVESSSAGHLPLIVAEKTASEVELKTAALALLGIVAELTGRYSPEQLAVSVGDARVGLAGWIIDRTLGAEADLDEASAKSAIADLCEQGLVQLSFSRRLATTEQGAQFWRANKPKL
jgi:ribonuclease D